MTTNVHLRRGLALAALVAGVVAPFLLTSFGLTVATTALIFAIFASGLNIVLGHGGLPSLGHAAFFGVGAYTVAMLGQEDITNVALTLPAAIVVTALLGLALGPILLRTRGEYFLMATVAVGEVLRNIAISWRPVTGGDDGLYGTTPPVILGIDFSERETFYFAVLAILVVVLGLIAMAMNAPFGHTLRALRDNRSRMSVLGVRPVTVELVGFALSAGVAGLAGALFAYANGFVSPGVLSVETSGRALLMVVLGGSATIAGPVIGAIVIESIRGVGSSYTDRWLTLLGLLYVLVALDPRGLAQRLWTRGAARVSGARRGDGDTSAPVEGEPPPPVLSVPGGRSDA